MTEYLKKFIEKIDHLFDEVIVRFDENVDEIGAVFDRDSE